MPRGRRLRLPPADHRGPAHGRHERGGRLVRRRQDVPAAGDQVRARDEEVRRAPHPLHGRGAPGERRHGRGGERGRVPHRHRQGRRARHRQEHRRRGARVQQLQGD